MCGQQRPLTGSEPKTATPAAAAATPAESGQQQQPGGKVTTNSVRLGICFSLSESRHCMWPLQYETPVEGSQQQPGGKVTTVSANFGTMESMLCDHDHRAEL